MLWRVLVVLGLLSFCQALSNRPGFNIGTRRYGRDVVADGFASPDWTNVSSIHGKDFPAGTLGFGLYLSLNYSELRDSEPYQHYKVSLNNLNPAILYLVTPEEDQLDGTVKTTDMGGKELRFEFACLKEGMGYVILVFDLDNPRFNSLALYLQHECRRPRLNVATPVSKGYPNIIEDGKVLPSFRYVAGVNEEQTGFAVWLGAGDPIKEQHYYPRFEYDPEHVIPTVATDGKPARPLTAGPVAAFTMKYGCHAYIQEPTSTWINISLNVGWKEPLRFEYTKVCGAATGESRGWSPAGIFFFVLFIIALVAFFAAMVYNYIMLHKRGWEMVPGVECIRSLRNRDATQYVPQANYDTGYQTDL